MGMEEGVLLDRGLRLKTVSEFEARSLEFQLQNQHHHHHHQQQQQHHQQGICIMFQDAKPRNQISSSGFCSYSDFSSTPTSIPQLLDQVHSFESSSSSSQMIVNHPEIFNLENGMELLGFKNLQQTLSNRDSTMTPKSSYSLNPLNNRNSSAVFWKGSAGNQPKSDHVSYQSLFDQNPIQKHDFSGGFSDLATHSSSSELSRGSETPKFTIEIPLQIDASQPNQTQSLIVTPETAWQQNRFMASCTNCFQGEEKEDDSSLRCVFPCEGNKRPSQGLSLSLSPHKPCNIGLQSFELRDAHSRDGFSGRSLNQFLQDGRQMLSSSSSPSCFHPQQLKNSKYLAPAQELLNEFCNIGTKQTINSTTSKNKFQKTSNWDGHLSCRNSEGTNQSFYCTDVLELQKRKAKLVFMLEEVDRRYKQYCEQMRAVVSSFESVAGNGAANVYLALASKAMSRHFRCLRDGVVGQIQAMKKAMGEKDPVAPGTTKGETPRLKLLDQSLRQQRAFQQMGAMENHPWRPQRGLPERSVSVLRAWLFEHFLHPYPSDVDKHILARQTGLSRSQVSNWFINARVRLWKPMVEEMYLEEKKAQDKAGEDDVGLESGLLNQRSDPNTNPNPNPSYQATTLQGSSDDPKPTPQPHFNDSESLASIVNSETRLHRKGETQQQEQFGRGEAFGAIDLDFSSYNNTVSTVTYSNEESGGFRNFSNGVSLTLGLQHSGSGVSLSFSPAAQHSLFFSRDHIDECQPVEYAVLDGEESHGNGGFESQALPYRNLVGAQLLHDFAG